MTDLKRYHLDRGGNDHSGQMLRRADGKWTPYDEAERALLEARAECEGAHMIIATERAEVIKLRAENARLRAERDAWRKGSEAQASEVKALRKEIARLTGCLKTANDNHEHFEREWYLAKDDRDRLAADLAAAQAQIEALRNERDAAAEARDAFSTALSQPTDGAPSFVNVVTLAYHNAVVADLTEAQATTARLEAERDDLAFMGRTLQGWTQHDALVNHEGAYQAIKAVADRLAALSPGKGE